MFISLFKGSQRYRSLYLQIINCIMFELPVKLIKRMKKNMSIKFMLNSVIRIGFLKSIKEIFLFLILSLVIIDLSAEETIHPRAIGGVLDLTNWDYMRMSRFLW